VFLHRSEVTMEERIRNEVGRAFAFECGVRELWPEEGPRGELRTKVEARALPPAQLVLMRFALDFYDGSGGNLGFVEATRLLMDCDGRDGMEGLFFLAEFIGSALTDMPESLELWVTQYNDEFTSSETQ
jgi:hypothetical protein